MFLMYPLKICLHYITLSFAADFWLPNLLIIRKIWKVKIYESQDTDAKKKDESRQRNFPEQLRKRIATSSSRTTRFHVRLARRTFDPAWDTRPDLLWQSSQLTDD